MGPVINLRRSLLKPYSYQCREIQQGAHEAAVVILVAVVIAIGLETHEEILMVIHSTNAGPNVERKVALPLVRLLLNVVTITKIGS